MNRVKTITEWKALKLELRVSEIALLRISQGDFLNPFVRHRDSNDALLNVVFKIYEERLTEEADKELERKGLVKVCQDNKTRIVEVLNKGFKPILVTEEDSGIYIWLFRG